jgi:DNA polymerase-4
VAAAGSRKIIHIDMDAFYASVEQRDDPALRGRPVVVGGSADDRGVVAAASYEARTFGIRSAMPMRTALRLCPGLTRVPTDFDRYRAVSRQLLEIFHEHTDLVEPVALDEAYLDVTWNKQEIPFGHRVARTIKAEVRRRLQLTASAGVAPSKFVAKIASDADKPDGLVTVMPHQVRDFLDPLPVSRIPGVGQVTGQQLAEMGIERIEQLAATDEATLIARFGRRGHDLYERAHGRDDDPVTPEREPKQVSSETTFSADVYDRDEMQHALHDLAHDVAGRLRRRQLRGRIIHLKARYPDFETVTRSRSGSQWIDAAATIVDVAVDLLQRTDADRRGVRLLGVGVSGFDTEESRSLQQDLFDTVPA